MTWLWVWGIDPGWTTAGIAVIEATTGRFQTNTVAWPAKPPDNPVSRMLDIRDTWDRFARAMESHFPPATIAVENGFGADRRPYVPWATALTCEAVGASWLVTPGAWKKGALGHGNATKEFTLAWAMRQGAREGTTEHEADALGIARYAQLEFANAAEVDAPGLSPLIGAPS